MTSPPVSPIGQPLARRAFLRYGLATFGWTWAVWWTAVFAQRALPEPLVPWFFALGGLGPAAGVLFVIRGTDRAYKREFVHRLWDPRRISGLWWVALSVVALLPPLAGYLFAAAAGRAPIGDATVTAGTVAFLVGFALAAGAVEEPGWRGVALDVLQPRTVPAVAALLIGVQWALWHLPLFFLEGTYQHGLGFGSARFWLFNGYLSLLGVLYVWLCNGSRGSILAAVLAHAGTNVASSLIPQDTLSDVLRLILTLFGVIVVVWFTRGDLHHTKNVVRAAQTS